MPRRAPRPLLSFVIDTREQLPWDFRIPRRDRFDDAGVVKYALDAGDYSAELDGVLLPIRIERKSIVDFFGVCGRGRERFAGRDGDGLYQSGPNKWVPSELERLRKYRSYLLIEATAEEVRHGCERSQVSGEAALGSAICWSVSYEINVIFAGDRRNGRDICQRLLEEFAHHVIPG
jgi:hypothetical protein